MRSISIPKTKLRPPTLHPSIVQRPRLTELLSDAGALTVIAAPGGSGKTTLVLEWLAAVQGSAAWYSLDADDNDPVRFMHGLVAALQTAGLKLKVASNQRNLKTIATDLINQLVTAKPVILVLDDYHLIHEESIHSALGYLLDHIPPSFQLVLITRETPPLPLARLRARRQLRELDLSALRFTFEETDRLLNDVMSLGLSHEQVRSLERYTQGWVAGLQMAGISFQTNRTLDTDTSQGSQFITDYLLTEILNRQPKHVQDFLLNTSIFERFSLPLCRAVVSETAGRSLSSIQKANLFVTTVGSWHQYHPIFREFLRTRLQNQFPQRVDELHRKALSWMETNGPPAEALQHARALADDEKYASIIETLAPDYLKRGELVTLRRWLEHLPETVIWKHPRLCLTQIWLLLDSNLQVDAQSYFDRLGTFLEKNLQSEFLALRALHAAMNHQPDAALRFAKRAQRSQQANDPFIQTYVSFGMGAAQKMGLRFFQAEQSFRDSLALADADGNSYIAIASLINLIDVLYLQARLHEAEHIAREAIKRFGNIPDARDWHWNLARIAYQHNDLDESLRQINRAIELSMESQDAVIHSRALLQRALIHHARGEKPLAQPDLDSADQLARGLQDQVILRSVIRQRALFAAAEGDSESAKQWLKSVTQPGRQPFPFFQSYALGRVLLAEKRFKEANAEFESALYVLKDADFALVRIEVMIWQSVALSGLGKVAEAAKTLKQAIKASQTENIIRPFVDARMDLLELIKNAGRDGFIWLLESFHETGAQAEGPALTRREREILQLLAVGLSNQEMADRLVIAEGTLKRHIANLYQKLGVHNRAQAIRHFNRIMSS